MALATSFVLYVAVGVVAVGAIGADAMGRTASPLQAAAAAFPTKGMSQIVGAGAMTAMLGVLLSQVFGISRMVFAMARKRDLPHTLEHVHPAYAVPDRAIVLAGAIIVVVALLGTLKSIVAAASFTILVYTQLRISPRYGCRLRRSFIRTGFRRLDWPPVSSLPRRSVRSR